MIKKTPLKTNKVQAELKEALQITRSAQVTAISEPPRRKNRSKATIATPPRSIDDSHPCLRQTYNPQAFGSTQAQYQPSIMTADYTPRPTL